MDYENLTPRIREMLRDLGFTGVKVWHCSPMFWSWTGYRDGVETGGGIGFDGRVLDICEGTLKGLKTITEVKA